MACFLVLRIKRLRLDHKSLLRSRRLEEITEGQVYRYRHILFFFKQKEDNNLQQTLKYTNTRKIETFRQDNRVFELSKNYIKTLHRAILNLIQCTRSWKHLSFCLDPIR